MSIAEVNRLITARRCKKTMIKELVTDICTSPTSEYANGFFYKDLTELKNVILQLFNKIQTGMDDLLPGLIMFVDHCKNPFQRIKASDEVTHRPLLPGFLDAFVEILRPGSLSATKAPIDQTLLKSICSFLHCFATDGTKEVRAKAAEAAARAQTAAAEQDEGEDPFAKTSKSQMGSGRQRKQKQEEEAAAAWNPDGDWDNIKKFGTKNLKAIEETDIPEILVHLLADFTLNADISACIIQVISALTVYSNITMKLGELSILKDLIGIICNCPNFREPLVNMCIENVWNILENCGMGSVETLATEETMLMMREMLEKVISNGYKLDDRHLRNEMTILLCALAACDEAHSFFLHEEEAMGGVCFFDDLIRYSTCDELNLTINEKYSPTFGIGTEDLEFKKLVWTAVSRILSSGNQEAFHKVEKSDFVSTLLLYLDTSQKSAAISRWAGPQLQEIQQHSLRTLFHIIALIPDLFQRQNGNYCLVNFLSNSSNSESIKMALKLMEVASQFPSYKVEIAEEGAFDLLYDIVERSDSTLEIRELAISVISNICKECRQNQKEFRRKGWVEILTKSIGAKHTLQGDPENFQISVLDSLWHSTLSNKRNRIQFLDIEGVAILLDYLDDCPELIRNLVVACLCSLMQNERAQSAFLGWNSHQSMCNATQLLIKLWETEEKRLGISYDLEGVLIEPPSPEVSVHSTISNTGSPGAAASQMSFHSGAQTMTMSGTQGSKAFERLNAALKHEDKESDATKQKRILMEYVREKDLRASVYSLLSLIGFDSSELLPKEKQKLEVIRMYPEFRQGEIWKSISSLLRAEGVKATSDDQAWLESCIDNASELKEQTIKNQKFIAKDVRKGQEDNLKDFYKTLLSS